jgi:hypothetical protein
MLRLAESAGGWRWRVTTYYKDTGMVATQTVHNSELPKNLEVAAAEARADVDASKTEIEEA